MPLPDDEFGKFLTIPRLKQDYENAVEKKEKEIRNEFKQNPPVLREQKATGIGLEKRHRTILNLAVFPFTGGQPGATLGYDFVRGSPLAELGVPNFDFLLFKQDPRGSVTIFGEGKGSISDPPEVIRQTIERREIALQHIDYVKAKYLNLPVESILTKEFVLVCPSTECNEVVRAVEKSDPKLIVWHAPLAGDQILKLVVPSDSAPEHHRMLHGDKELNILLQKAHSSSGSFDLWPKMHPALKLGATYRRLERDQEDYPIVTRDIVKDVVASDMFYLTEQEQEQQVSEIIDLGLKVGFLRPVQNGAAYRVGSPRDRKSTIEERAIAHWIDWSLDQELATRIQQAKAMMQDEYRRERKRSRSLDDHWGQSF